MYQPKILGQQKVYHMDTIVTFGKYRDDGYTVSQILSLEPSYIQWCIENHKGFEADPEVTDAAERLNDPDSFDDLPFYDEGPSIADIFSIY